MLFICFEVSLRIVGVTALQNDDYSILCSPKNAFIGDSVLGIRLNPGSYSITLNKKHKFDATHTDNGQRLVTSVGSGPKIYVLGCSFTYGYGVNDNQHFTSLLQDRLPQYSFENRAVIGYGTVQSLLQLKETFIKETPSSVLLCLSDVHLERNTLSQSYRSALKIGYSRSSDNVDNLLSGANFPYFSTQDSIEFVSWEAMYSNWWLRDYSATINFLQTKYENLLVSDQKEIEVTTSILREINRLCKDEGVNFGIIYLDKSDALSQVKKDLNSIESVDVNFDFSDSTFTNAPYDNHPNSRGHQKISKKVEELILKIDLSNEQ